jgi:hypothetical protein
VIHVLGLEFDEGHSGEVPLVIKICYLFNNVVVYTQVNYINAEPV